jgi:HlyD family secretion protein
MNIKKDFLWLPVLGAFCVILFLFQRYHQHAATDALFYTEQATKRTLVSSVNAKGFLIPQEIIKIGNLINGIVRYLYAEEDELVEEGQLLAEIDDSLEDSAVNTAFGNFDAEQAALKYQLEFLKRQEQLYGCKQISLDAYQQAERSYQAALAKVEATKGLYETAKLIYDNKRIHAPASGMIIAKIVSIGEAVSNYSPASILYFMAKDIRHMQAHIILNDKNLEILRPGTTAYITTIAYPHYTLSGPITTIGNMPHGMQLADYVYSKLLPANTPEMHPCATVPIENHDLLLKPGMTFTARIVIEQKENVLSIKNEALNIPTSAIEQLAHQRGYSYQPLDGKTVMQASHENLKTIWIVERKTFIQKEISTGMSDGDFVEVTKGLNGSEEIVCSINECHSLIQALQSYFAPNAKA